MSYLSDLLGANYKAGMSEDEISAALETAKVGDTTGEVERLKASLSKSNADAAKYKRELREKQTDDEAAAATRKEEHDKLVEDNQKLTDQITLMTQVGKLRDMGYDTALATATAEAMIKGDMETVLANQSKFLEARDKAAKAEGMRATPRPAVGAGNGEANYREMADKAQLNGDYTLAAYYTRLAEQDSGQA
jgi:hypothetical protein